MTFERCVNTSQGCVEYTAQFEEEYDGIPPQSFLIGQQCDTIQRSIQEFCNDHGTDVHVIGVYLNKTVYLGVYKHSRLNRIVNNRLCYELFLWNAA